MSNDAAIAHTVLKQAASWLLLMQDGPLNAARQDEFERWQAQSAEHQRAWRRAEQLLDRLASLPPDLAKRTLDRPSATRRRTVLGGMILLLGGAPLAWWSWRAQVWRSGFAADYITALGQRRDIVNPDGTQVSLNADTALDVLYEAEQRLLRLYRGEVFISSAKDRQTPVRPLLVQTAQGLLLALGTQFSVRQLDNQTLLAVYDGAVQVRPAGMQVAHGSHIIRAGQQVRFSREHIGPVEVARQEALAWRNGLLWADDMPLGEWAAQLMRYGGGHIECDASVLGLSISGNFPLDDPSLALEMLAQTYALRIEQGWASVTISR